MDTRNLDKKKWYAAVEIVGDVFFKEAESEEGAHEICRRTLLGADFLNTFTAHHNGLEWLVE